jgi:hypothetical protein
MRAKVRDGLQKMEKSSTPDVTQLEVECLPGMLVDLKRLDEKLKDDIQQLEVECLSKMLMVTEPDFNDDKAKKKLIKAVKEGSFDKGGIHRDNCGTAYERQRYPWLEQKYYTRSPAFLDGVQEQYNDLGLRIGPSGVSNDLACLGLFANQNFASDEEIFRELTIAAKTAGKTHDYLLETVLAFSLRQNVHPLEIPQIQTLAGTYGNDWVLHFSPYQTISEAFNYLQKQGADIYSEESRKRYDTEYLITLDNRIRTNCWAWPMGNATLEGIAPLYTFINHSCEPNVAWDIAPDEIMKVQAKKAIKRGEELFLTYIELQANDSGKTPIALEERREKLRSWFGQDCKCSRCQEEEAKQSAEDGTSTGSPLSSLGSTPPETSPGMSKKRKRSQEPDDRSEGDAEYDAPGPAKRTKTESNSEAKGRVPLPTRSAKGVRSKRSIS